MKCFLYPRSKTWLVIIIFILARNYPLFQSLLLYSFRLILHKVNDQNEVTCQTLTLCFLVESFLTKKFKKGCILMRFRQIIPWDFVQTTWLACQLSIWNPTSLCSIFYDNEIKLSFCVTISLQSSFGDYDGLERGGLNAV